MRNQIVIVFLLTVFTVMMMAPAGLHAEGKAPVAVFETNTFDFGTAYEGNTVTHDFVVKNTGNADLEIYEVKSG